MHTAEGHCVMYLGYIPETPAELGMHTAEYKECYPGETLYKDFQKHWDFSSVLQIQGAHLRLIYII